MKKTLSVLLSLVLLTSIILSGCGTTKTENSTGGDTQVSTTQAKQESDTKKTMALLIPSPVGDPFIALCVKGLNKLAEETGAELKIIETLDKAEYEDQVRAMAELGANPVYTMWGDLSELAVKVAPEYPDTNFILCDVYMETAQPNVSSISVDPFESSFIAGFVAAHNTTVKKVGFIAHADRPVSRRFKDGFTNGVHYADPSITVDVSYVGNDQDPVKGAEVAKLMIQNNGVDLIFQAASRSGLGVLNACKELGIKSIGSDDWQGDVNDFVFWSALKPINEALYVEGKSSFDGKFEGGDKAYGLAQDLPMYDQRDFDKLPKDLQEKVTKLVADLKSGAVDALIDTAQ